MASISKFLWIDSYALSPYQLYLRDLRYFETIAEAGHLGRAAKQLCRSQPALTGCIRRLEQALDTQLFERVGRGIRLTAAGEVLLKRARRLHIAAEETARGMKEIAQGDAGYVRIGILPTVAHLFLAPVCRLFLAEVKGVTLKTILGQNDVLNASLKAGELDLVVSFEAETDDQFVSHTISEDMCVVAAAGSHEICRKRAKMQDLLAYRWVLAGPSVESRQWLDRAFDLHRLPRLVRLRTTIKGPGMRGNTDASTTRSPFVPKPDINLDGMTHRQRRIGT